MDDNLVLSVDDALDDVGVNEPEDDTHSIPPDVIDTPVIAETTVEEGKRVVVPSELVDSLINESDLTLDEQEEPIQINNEREDPNPISVDEVMPTSEIQEHSVLTNELTQADAFTLSNKELMTISDKRYLLQLAALTNEEAVQEFLEEHQIGQLTRTYQTLRNGSIWYIVTFGDYASISSARGAVQTLPNSVQALGPWAKSLVQVHREIDSVK